MKATAKNNEVINKIDEEIIANVEYVAVYDAEDVTEGAVRECEKSVAEIKNRWFELVENALEEVPQTGSYHTPLCNRVRKGYEWLRNNLSEEEYEEVEQFVNDREYELEGLLFAVEQKKESKMAKLHAEYCEVMEIRYDANKRDYVRF